MNKQGAPAQPHRTDDTWWDTVYDGPAGTLPDTPDADPGGGTVDEWFDTAAGLIAPQRTGEQAEEAAAVAAAVEPAAVEPVAERDSIDDWFDTALGVISPQRTSTETHKFPAPFFPPAPVTLDKPAPEPAPAEPAAAEDPHLRPTETAEPADTEAAVSDPQPAPAEALVPEPRPAAVEDSHPQPATEPAPDPQPEHAPDAAPVPEPTRDVPSAQDPRRQPEPEPLAGPSLNSAAVEDSQPLPGAESEPSAVLPSESASGRAPEQDPDPRPEPADVHSSHSRPEPEPDHTPEPAPSPRPAIRSPLADGGAAVPHVGERPPTYGPEPTAVPEADPGSLGTVVPDTVLEGAQYGSAILRAVSVRGDSARYRGEPRRDALLVTRFGDGPDGLLLAVLGGFDRTGTAADEAVRPEAVSVAAGEACRQLAATIGRSRAGLAADLRDGARDRLRYGLQRLATGAAGPLRALAPRGDGDETPSPASLHCLMVSLDPAAGYRAAFGVGPGGLYLLRSGHWIDAYAARLLHHPDGQPPVPDAPVPDPRPFRFRLVPATPGDILLLCTPGLADPIADEPAVAHFLSAHWAHPHPPGAVDFLRQVQVRAKGYADDRTAAAIWTE
ncbi:protein phosphatase 2C domain-containing protein [Kitasatospora aureofaciens]|uniref:protein phosphatase 2C domain-containing protein n=1 Tax=Kitasatospora aureofaciens TaxID=1894 RepID=UPI001C473F4C|nr:protein phosphatase 2C domain-containing protein [Kitasatospora aureofaciens]MBV6700689.1 protein phosphatase 2C domain-containing protein [Kitasatospora aureofaciens]